MKTYKCGFLNGVLNYHRWGEASCLKSDTKKLCKDQIQTWCQLSDGLLDFPAQKKTSCEIRGFFFLHKAEKDFSIENSIKPTSKFDNRIPISKF